MPCLIDIKEEERVQVIGLAGRLSKQYVESLRSEVLYKSYNVGLFVSGWGGMEPVQGPKPPWSN